LLAAAIFAVHPVHAESVAWVSELKNVLSGFFYLLSLLFYLRFSETPEPDPRAPGRASSGEVFYWLSLLLYLCALGSKTVTCTLPAAILIINWWRTGRLGWRDMRHVAPMLVLGLAAGLLTIHVEALQAVEGQDWWTLSITERCLVAGRAFWFYVGKLLWPQGLAFNYPRWAVSQGIWWQYLFPVAAAGALAALWAGRRALGRGPLTAILFFAVSLGPTLGFFYVEFMKYSYVADHFQYLASLGPIALFAAAATRLGECLAGPARSAALPVTMAMLSVLGWLTWGQELMYENSDRVWLDTIEKNPSSWLAHNNLGMSLAVRGRFSEAIGHYREALRLRRDYVDAHNNWGVALAAQGRLQEAIAHYREALRFRKGLAEAHNNWGIALAREGRFQEAVAQFQEALILAPGDGSIQVNCAKACLSLARAHAKQGLREATAQDARQAVLCRPDDPALLQAIAEMLRK
jgi:tetratricopeptide (TPR) repeat protein